MLILGLDFETTGIDPLKDRIIELGACLFETENSLPVALHGYLVKPQGDFVISPEASAVNGINPAEVLFSGVPQVAAIAQLVNLIERSDFVVGHNIKGFDWPFLKAEFDRCYPGQKLPERPLIDTMTDIAYPPHIRTRKLVHLAAEHGFLNPFPHRALFDVMACLHLFSKYPLSETVELAAAKTIKVKALVGFDTKDAAKARYYHWNPIAKIWFKEIKEFQLEQERREAGFPVEVLPDAGF